MRRADNSAQLADTYFIQRYAMSIMRQMTPIPINFTPPPHVLRGMEPEAFIAAFHRYQELLRSIYLRIATQPETSGLDLTSITPQASEKAGKREGKAKASFRRVLDALRSIAVLGQWDGDTLRLDTCESDERATAEAKRGFRGGIAARLLREAGFAFEGLMKNGRFPDASPLLVRFPADPAILIALKAFENIPPGDRIGFCDYRDIIGNADYTISDVLRALPTDDLRGVFAAADERLAGHDLLRDVRYTGFLSWDVKYFFRKERKETAVFHLHPDEGVEFNLRPLHVSNYAHRFDALNEHIRALCLNGADCRFCGYCKTPHRFTYHGREYVKCQILCGNFHLYALTKEDIPSIMSLIDWELDEKIVRAGNVSPSFLKHANPL